MKMVQRLAMGILIGMIGWCASTHVRGCSLKITFTQSPVFVHDHIEPGTCKEHYDKGKYAAVPRYGGSVNGTSPVKVYFSTNYWQDGFEYWVLQHDMVYSKDCAQTQVTWGNGDKRSGYGDTTYTFTTPRTPISYCAQFTTAWPQQLGKKLEGSHLSTGTDEGGNGTSVLTWELVNVLPVTNVVPGTKKALNDNPVYLYEYQNGEWLRLRVLPVP